MRELRRCPCRPGDRLEALVFREAVFGLGRAEIYGVVGYKQALMFGIR